MSEEKYKLQPIGVRYVCDECGEGHMEVDGTVLTSCPPWYGHSCTECGHTENFRESYPTIRYEEPSEDVLESLRNRIVELDMRIRGSSMVGGYVGGKPPLLNMRGTLTCSS